MLKFKWFGHSMWNIVTENCSIIIDPFTDIGYPMPKNLTADMVISSHDHSDHNNFKLLIPPFKKITQIGSYQHMDMKIKLIEASHGRYNGKNLGDIYLILIYVNGMSILHCGDLGVIPDEETLCEIDDIDFLLVPVGGNYTLNAEGAKNFIDLIKPKVVFPMHYKTPKVKIEIEGIEPFLTYFPDAECLNSDFIEISKEELNTDRMRVIKLNYE